jgi:hypothetical protein
VYQLELPPTWKIFNTFHAALLSPYKETEEHGVNFTEPPPNLVDDQEEYEVEEVLATCLYGQWKKRQYLIKWKGYADAHNSWEPAENVNAPELVKEFHQQTGVSARLRVLEGGGQRKEHTMTQSKNSTPPPRPHSPRTISTFSLNQYGDYPLLDQILLDGPMLEQPWFDDDSPYTCQAACRKAVAQEVRERLAMISLAQSDAGTDNATPANEDLPNPDADKDDGGALACPGSSSDSGTDQPPLRQRAPAGYERSPPSTVGPSDLFTHTIRDAGRAGSDPHLAREGLDHQVGVDHPTPEVAHHDMNAVESPHLCSWDTYSPYDHSKGDALYEQADLTTD